jgi:hypothetical protein
MCKKTKFFEAHTRPALVQHRVRGNKLPRKSKRIIKRCIEISEKVRKRGKREQRIFETNRK